MLMLDGASLSALETYEKGMVTLMQMHPHAWDRAVIADEIMRSERWERLHDMYALSKPAGWDPKMPWDFVIRVSAYGQGDMEDGPQPCAFWWRKFVEHPAGLQGKASEAFVAQIEGARARAKILAGHHKHRPRPLWRKRGVDEEETEGAAGHQGHPATTMAAAWGR